MAGMEPMRRQLFTFGPGALASSPGWGRVKALCSYRCLVNAMGSGTRKASFRVEGNIRTRHWPWQSAEASETGHWLVATQC